MGAKDTNEIFPKFRNQEKLFTQRRGEHNGNYC